MKNLIEIRIKFFGILISCMMIYLNSSAQEFRYFEFKTSCGHGNWQDTTFIAWTSNQAVIDTVLANIKRPENQRKFIAGKIDYGNGGQNRNASHWFLWHFTPDQWDLAEMAIEVCDGCPYSDLDADTAYWIGNIGSYCPWSGIPSREVTNQLGIKDLSTFDNILIYPNPAQSTLIIQQNGSINSKITLHDAFGKMIKIHPSNIESDIKIDISSLKPGVYFISFENEQAKFSKKLVIE